METLPFIPGTDREVVFDTGSGVGREIWYGYLATWQEQKKTPPPEDDWMKIRVPESGDATQEINKFREAINIFMRFLVGLGADNCLAVKHIEPFAAAA
jgi:hypothetical protein